MTSNIITCLIVGYFFGCISTSYIIGKIYSIDIREHGSGNAGTTNTMRVLGKQAGMLVYLGDCIKCALAILIMVLIFVNSSSGFDIQLVKLVTGFGVVLGHNFPFWLKFKGGKGIAVTSAVILIFCLPTYWICPSLCLIAFVGILQSTKYVSLGSLAVVTIFLGYVAIVFSKSESYLYILFFTALFTVSAYITHRANIVRLINGTENKMGAKKNIASSKPQSKSPVANNTSNMNNNINNGQRTRNIPEKKTPIIKQSMPKPNQNKELQKTADLKRFYDAEEIRIPDLDDPAYDNFSVDINVDKSQYKDAIPLNGNSYVDYSQTDNNYYDNNYYGNYDNNEYYTRK